ncbi:MAG: type II secretion system protein [Patescibacteria group bacterium]
MIKREGFTMVEILVYVAVLGLLVSAIASFFLWASNVSAKNQAMAEVLNNGQRALSTITIEIRKAKTVYSPTMSASQLSLETNDSLGAGETSGFVDFFLCGEQLCLKREGQPVLAITSDKVVVSYLSFTVVNYSTTTASVQIGLKVDYKGGEGKAERQAAFNATSTAALRPY